MIDTQGTAGNGVVTVLIHEQDESSQQVLDEAVFSALQHFGIPYTTEFVDTQWSDSVKAEEVLDSAALLFPQSGTMELFSSTYQQRIEQAVSAGLGIIAYEPKGTHIPAWLRKLMGLCVLEGSGTCSQLVTAGTGCYITRRRTAGETQCSDTVCTYARIRKESGDIPVLQNEHQDGMLFTGYHGEGTLVLFPFSIEFYTMPYLGHACGADDIFRSAIIYAARKPFLTWSMPETAGMVIDDCSGSYNHFGYVDSLNRYGWAPYLALFTDTIDEVAHADIHKGARTLKRHHEEKTAEIGFHALRYNTSFCFDHLERRPLTDQELRDRFARWDYYEKQWGITHSPWAHPHFGEIGANALPFYRERGIEYLTYLLPFDAAWFDVPGRYAPLPPMAPFGHPGYYFIELQESPGMIGCNCVLDRKCRDTTDYVVQTDFLWGHTPFWEESGSVNIGMASKTLAAQVRRGIDSGFYGEGATHEQRIACLRDGELREILEETKNLLSSYTIRFASMSSMLKDMHKHMNGALSSVEVNRAAGTVEYLFDSDQIAGTEIQLHMDGGVEQRYSTDGKKGILYYMH